VIGFYGFLGCFNAGAWIWAFLAFHDKPVLLRTAFLAYTFGLRHGVDADHIAAIDNVTRKLMQEGRRPLSVGFFFSLGHSTIVVVASLVVFLTATVVATQLDAVKSVSLTSSRSPAATRASRRMSKDLSKMHTDR
jgi:nickel/cobalt transporter (NiCoT) family protein